jgi:hypothetical protein
MYSNSRGEAVSTTTPPGDATGKTWGYTANLPQRYSVNYARYLSLGGPVQLDEFVRGFVAGGENRHDMARFYFFCLVFDQLAKEEVPGDLVELGAYKGHTATLLANMARKLGRTAYIMDTFEGFHTGDLNGIDAAASSQSFSDTSLEAVRAAVGEDNVRYVKGYFPGTAHELPDDGRYCLVHIDCDLYAPIKSALEYFYPRTVPGGFLIIHDYSSLYWSGAEKAIDEFFADKPEAVLPLPDSAGSVAVRKVRPPDSNGNWLEQKRASLLRNEWVSSAHGGLRELLGSGWSGSEDWGVWGVGEAHELLLVLPPQVDGEIELQMDVHVVLLGYRTSQQFDISVGGQTLAKWDFALSANRGIRSVRIPAPAAAGNHNGPRSVRLMFRPLTVASPAELDPTLTERRPVGLALHRMRFDTARGQGSVA